MAEWLRELDALVENPKFGSQHLSHSPKPPVTPDTKPFSGYHGHPHACAQTQMCTDAHTCAYT